MDGEQNLARYPLAQNGTVGHWLACGPVTSPLRNLDEIIDPDGSPFGADGRWIINYWAYEPVSQRVKSRVYERLLPLEWKPQGTPLPGKAGSEGGLWQYRAVEDDQVVDFSRFNFRPTLMQAWVYARLYSGGATTVHAELHTIGPAHVWLNNRDEFHYQARFSYVAPLKIPVELTLKPGFNDLYLHGVMPGWREARLALGLRLRDNPPITVCLPLGDIHPEQWHRAEQQLNAIHIRQFAFSQLPAQIHPHSSLTAPFDCEIAVSIPLDDRLQDVPDTPAPPTGKTRGLVEPGRPVPLPLTQQVLAAMDALPGENTLEVCIKPADGTPLELCRRIWAGTRPFSTQPYGDYDSRRREALAHLAQIRFDVPAALAAVETGRATTVDSDAIALACTFMEQRHDCADFYAISLLTALYRYGDHPALRAGDKARIEAAFRNFKFWIDEPGLDAMCYFTENHQILFHVTAYLSGQRWPQLTFANSGQRGGRQKVRARRRIENWVLRRLRGGFSEWDSNAYMALDAYAMLALVEFADSARLRQMATALLHKIFFMIACQSFRGVHGSTHGRCYVEGLKSARVENTAGLQRIAWGMGMFNGETRATGMLALVRRYRVPEIIQRIGADVANTVHTRARSTARFRPQFDMRGDTWDVRTITHRTPDVMLSAAIDHRPGEAGVQEHLWQATLSPEAVVFTTYPGNAQEHGNARPNFWAGSARLPRVTLHERTVVCLYRIEPDVGLGFSHAYFPTMMFDEYHIDGNWAFARVHAGYVALWGDGALILTDGGRHAGQELRSTGAGRVWLCHVGRAADDGAFAAFREQTARNAPRADGDRVAWVTPQQQTLTFGWDEPFTVDGEAQDWEDFPHYENRYTQTPIGAETLRIQQGAGRLTLDLRHGRVTA